MWVRDLPEGAFEFPSTARIMPTPKVRGPHGFPDTARELRYHQDGESLRAGVAQRPRARPVIGLPQPVPPTRREFPVRRRSVRVVRWGPVQVVVAGCIGNGSSSASDPDGWNQFAFEPIAEKVGRAWTLGSADAGPVQRPDRSSSLLRLAEAAGHGGMQGRGVAEVTAHQRTGILGESS